MKLSTLELLCCPRCHAELILHGQSSDGIVDEGELYCSYCKQSYIISNGVVHFIARQELEGSDRRFARSYDFFSFLYAILIKVVVLPLGGERKARKQVLDRLELNGGRTLEVSIGPGGNLPYLFESPDMGEVFGLDLAADQLARCKGLVASRNWPVEFFLSTAEALPFKAGSFDNVFHVGGINFFSGKKRAIDEMIRVARPGSKIIIADESGWIARLLARIPGFLGSDQCMKLDTSVPLHMVPDIMEETRLDKIWKAYGIHCGYCLEFRKPAEHSG